MVRHAEIGLDDHAPGAIQGRVELFAKRRWLVPRRPENRLRLDSLIGDRHKVMANVGDLGIDANLDAELLELFHRPPR